MPSLPRAAAAIAEVDRWIRLHFLGFSFMWPLLGAASANPWLDWATLGRLFAVTFCFHVSGILLNDAVDLPVDRQNPARWRDPLVRGTLRRWQAVVIALAMIPLAMSMAVGRGEGAPAWLALAFAGMAAYNLWGKKCPVPPITDAAQGVAWGALTVWGALVAAPQVPQLGVILAVYAVLYLLLINGVHGGMRDLTSDLASGSRTTAIFLGIRPRPDGGIAVPRRAWAFCMAVQGAMAVLSLAPLASKQPGSSSTGLLASGLALVLLAGLNLRLMAAVLQPDQPSWGAVFRFHLVSLLLPLMVPFVGYADVRVLIVLAVMFFAPLILMRRTPAVVRWLATLGRSAARVS